MQNQIIKIKNNWVQVAVFVVAVLILIGSGGVWWYCVNNGYSSGQIVWNWSWSGFVKIECSK